MFRKQVIKVISDFDKLRIKFREVTMKEEVELTKKLNRGLLTYYILSALFFILRMLKPFLSEKQELPNFVLNHHELGSYFYFIYLYDIGISCIGISIYVGWDTLILAMVIEFILHLNSLKSLLPKVECLSEINCKERCMKSLSICVYYHYKLRR